MDKQGRDIMDNSINTLNTKNFDQKLTKVQILDIVKSNGISKCNASHKSQVMAFMFGNEFMASDDKGAKHKYGM